MDTESIQQLLSQRTIHSLPVLNAVLDLFNGEEEFGNTVFLMIQHALQTSACLIESLGRLGAKREDMFYLGKIYSASPAGSQAIKNFIEPEEVQSDSAQIKHFHAHAVGDEAIYEKRFSAVFDAAIDEMLSQFESFLRDKAELKGVKKIIILDDGGALTSRIITRFSEKPAFQTLLSGYEMSIVEQTTAGSRGIVEEFVDKPFDSRDPNLPSLCMPLVMVSSSAAKTVFESGMIQEAAFKSVKQLFPILLDERRKKLNIGIIGYGAIGSAIAGGVKGLSQRDHVYVYDHSDQAKIRLAKGSEGITTVKTLEELFECADYIFGASGNDVFREITNEKTEEVIDREAKEKVKGIIKIIEQSERTKHLVSVSLENKEFFSLIDYCNELSNKKDAKVDLSKLIVKDEESTEYTDCLKNIEISFNVKEPESQKAIVIYRGGFPINFLPPHYSVPAKEIQVIMGLLLCGIKQAYGCASKPEIRHHRRSGDEKKKGCQLITRDYVKGLDARFQRYCVRKWFESEPEYGSRYKLSQIQLLNDLWQINLRSSYV